MNYSAEEIITLFDTYAFELDGVIKQHYIPIDDNIIEIYVTSELLEPDYELDLTDVKVEKGDTFLSIKDRIRDDYVRVIFYKLKPLEITTTIGKAYI